jgi:hypothetical protein
MLSLQKDLFLEASLRILKKIITVIVVFLSTITSTFTSTFAVTEWIITKGGKNHSGYIVPIVEKHCMYPELTLAIICRESEFNPRASNKGSLGLGQIHYRVWKRQLPCPEGQGLR